VERQQGEEEIERTLFLDDDAAAGNQTLEELVTNIHRQAERHRSRTHPRARGPPEAEGNGDLDGGSTGRSPFASLSYSREKRGESSREVPKQLWMI